LLLLSQIEDLRVELQRKEQELMQMQAKMKTVEEQHADYQKHIAVLKESLIAKEEHYNMLQLDVSQFILPELDLFFHQRTSA
jgi:chromosome segregation ATPase